MCRIRSEGAVLEDAYVHTGSCVFSDPTGDHYQANTTAINSMHAVIPSGYPSNMYSTCIHFLNEYICSAVHLCVTSRLVSSQFMCSWMVLILNCVCTYTFLL